MGTWAYTLLVESRRVQPQVAGLLVGSYWAAFTVGRIFAGIYAKRVGVNRMVLGGLAVALMGAVLLWWNPANVANVISPPLIGLAIAPIFPALISGTSQRVGAHNAANTIGMQMAASGLGTAVIPSLIGILARQVSLEVIPACLMVLYTTLLGLFSLAVKRGSKAD